jgi:HEAT repeat protein
MNLLFVLSMLIVTLTQGPATKPPDIEALIKDLQSNDERASQEASEELLKAGTRAIPFLTSLIEKSQVASPRTAVAAVDVLGRMGPAAQDAIPALVGLLGRGGALGPAAVSALARIGEPAVPALVAAASNADSQMRAQAIWVLGQIGKAAEASVPVLLAALNDEDRYVRQYAVMALGDVRPQDASVLVALRGRLKDSDAGVRLSTIKALGQGGADARSASDELLELSTKEPNLRLPVAEALIRMAAADLAVRPLVSELGDRSSNLRTRAAMLLGELGDPAKPAIPALRQALADDDARVRRAADAALKRIAGSN